MSDPRVTVVMNVRNGAPWLREAIDSVFAQTFTDWELVVWDDCSTDDSAAIVGEYHDPRVRYFLSAEDTPLGTARNLALREARGEWVAFLDQDDIWLPRKLELQVGIADAVASGATGLIYGRTVEFFPDGRERDFDHHHEFSRLPEGPLLSEFFRKSCFVAISSAMIRRSALEGSEIPEQFQIISDFYLFLTVARHFEGRAVQEVVCRYRRHDNSLSRARRRNIYEEALLLLDLWDGPLESELAARARCSYHTAIAIGELSRVRTMTAGLTRLVTRGSLPYVASRPFVRAWRSLRSRFGTPRWTLPAMGPSTVIPRAMADRQDGADLTLSIIVVNWKVRDLLRECLNSVYATLELPGDSWELVVVDNDSQDGSAEMVAGEFPRATLIANRQNVGFARGNNQAFQLCRGRYVLLLNPDVVLLDPSVGRILRLMEERPEVGVAGCRLLNSDLSLQKWTAGDVPGVLNIACHFLFLYRLLPESWLPRPLFMEKEPTGDSEVGWVSGACMLLRRAALGGDIFDDQFFMYGEDLRLCQSMAEAGWKVVYTPHSEVLHHGGSSIDKQTPEVQLNKIRNLRKVFTAGHGKAATLCFDFIVSIGFLLRLIGFQLAARAHPGRGYEVRAERSLHFFSEAVRSLRERLPV